MTSSPEPSTSRRSPFWSAEAQAKIARWIPLAVFFWLAFQSARLGATDDEAYYWVLAQKPDWGYAYHPPMVAWCIAAAQSFTGWIFGSASTLVLRLPAALGMAWIIRLALQWLRETGAPEGKLSFAAWVIFSFAGLSALSWMMVPDVPLFVGWMMVFVATWRTCFATRTSWREPVMIGGGIFLASLAKFSGVLILVSSAGALLLWAPRERKWRAVAVLVASYVLSLVPILVWNAQHDWGALLYQFKERQGDGSLSFKRWLRFWAVELAVAGPTLVAFAGMMLVRAWRRDRIAAFCAVFMLPALVYCVQPLWADFKPHWAFVTWWPAVLALAWTAARGELRRLVRFQIAWGTTILLIVTLALHFPLGGLFAKDPRLDVTNDLHGWPEAAAWLSEPERRFVPVLASRYQTASQIAFALGSLQRVELVPRDLKARDEWPNLGVTSSFGPEWPSLLQAVYFVSDNRYDAPPEFKGAACVIEHSVQATRWGMPAKRIDLWRCR